MNSRQTAGVLEEVLSERARQDARWGEKEHALSVYFLLLAEQVGKASKTMLESEVNLPDLFDGLGAIRTEVLQVAAVAVAMVERIDRLKQEGA